MARRLSEGDRAERIGVPSQGKRGSVEPRCSVENADTSYEHTQIWIVWSERDCSLTQLLVSSWSNFTDLKGNRGNEEVGVQRRANSGQISWVHSTPTPKKPFPTSANRGHSDPQWGQRVSGKKCDTLWNLMSGDGRAATSHYTCIWFQFVFTWWFDFHNPFTDILMVNVL